MACQARPVARSAKVLADKLFPDQLDSAALLAAGVYLLALGL